MGGVFLVIQWALEAEPGYPLRSVNEVGSISKIVWWKTTTILGKGGND